ncbi:hypothetical protein SAMN05661080_03680 [Modestobacter sp. DSM 44400]|nr:hypothetical protein [Modestobacter sp. DSM 44400]SDY50144.1 hypothetical protein SAMN05661080_03680 [Modestobacter sp. DSM 44400]
MPLTDGSLAQVHTEECAVAGVLEMVDIGLTEPAEAPDGRGR